MNGGNKQYIGKDGFMDVYNATPGEEAEWAKEVVTAALLRINNESNATDIKFAVDNLLFHDYKGLELLLISKLNGSGPVRQIALAAALWNIYKYPQSFAIIMQNLTMHRKECLKEVFSALMDFKTNEAAKKFLFDCIEGDDEELKEKAQVSLGIWTYRH